MKIAGKKVEGPNVEILVIPRNGEDGNIVFKAQAIMDLDDFNALCPRPKAPIIRNRDGSRREDLSDVKYRKAIESYASKQNAYIVLKSLEATEDLEWETVNMNDPDTWVNYIDELKSSGFSTVEVNLIVGCVMKANCLDDAKLEEARKSFLAGQAEMQKELSIQNIEQSDTPYGERASA